MTKEANVNNVETEQLNTDDVSCNAFDEVRKLDNEHLRNLLKEVKDMGKQHAPRYFKQSNKMKQLFKLEKTDYYDWVDQFIIVKRAIESEILYRFRTGAL